MKRFIRTVGGGEGLRNLDAGCAEPRNNIIGKIVKFNVVPNQPAAAFAEIGFEAEQPGGKTAALFASAEFRYLN